MLVGEGQSLLDIAIEKCGDISAAFDIALLNGISVSESLLASQKLAVVDSVNKDVSNYFASKRLKPATWNAASLNQEGIDFWAIEVDFIVQ